MTEAEWWASAADPGAMLDLVERRASLRKLRLIAVACLRRVGHLIDDPRVAALVDAVELLCDAAQAEAADLDAAESPVIDLWTRLPEATDEEWRTAHHLVAAARHLRRRGSIRYAVDFVQQALASRAGRREADPARDATSRAEASAQADLVRAIIGPPGRPFGFDRGWLAGAGRPAVERARVIDEAGDFAAIPDLARLIEAAGPDDPAVLDHCRGAGPFVRGDWVVDALLGRAPGVTPGLLTQDDWRACPDPTSLLVLLRFRATDHRWRRFAVACCRRVDRWIGDERLRAAVDAADRHNDGLIPFDAVEAADRAAEPARREAARAEWHAEAEANFCITPEYAAVQRDYYAAEATRGAGHRDPRLGTRDEIGRDDPVGWGTAHYWAAAVAGVAVVARADLWDPALNEPDDPTERPGQCYPIANNESVEARKAYSRVDELARAAQRAERLALRDLLLDIFGDLIGPTGPDGCWLPAGPGGPVTEWWCCLPTPISAPVGFEWLDAGDGVARRLARQIHDDGAFGRLPELAHLLEAAGCADSEILGHLRGPGPHARGCWVLDRLLGFGPKPAASAP